MVMSNLSFNITKSFGKLQLTPQTNGLRMVYTPMSSKPAGAGEEVQAGACDILLPLEALGGLWATAKAFLYGVESLDENVIMRGTDGDILIKLYRDKPKGNQGSLSGEELTWLRIVSGRSEDERRRIKLGPRDLICIELACQATLTIGNK